MVDNLNQAYTYDAEGRISSVAPTTGGTTIYKYDSEGQLVYESVGSGVRLYQRNTAGQPTWIYPPTGVTPYYDMSAYIDGELIGVWEGGGAFRWVGKDWLGTKRYESYGQGDVASNAVPVLQGFYTSLPFGDALSSIGLDPGHFTGKERDSESGLDYFGARYYSSSMGRFMSPDPSGLTYADPTNPQSLNLYSYGLNNPLKFVDPTGLHFECTSRTISYENGDGTTNQSSTPACKWVEDYDDPVTSYVFQSADPSMIHRQASAPVTTAPNKVPTLRNPNLPNCYAVEINTFMNDMNPFSFGYSSVTGLTGEAMTSASAAKATNAAIYAATTINTKGGIGLLQPLKSSTYRGLLADAEILSKGAFVLNLLTVDAAVVHAGYAAWNTPCQVP